MMISLGSMIFAHSTQNCVNIYASWISQNRQWDENASTKNISKHKSTTSKSTNTDRKTELSPVRSVHSCLQDEIDKKRFLGETQINRKTSVAGNSLETGLTRDEEASSELGFGS